MPPAPAQASDATGPRPLACAAVFAALGRRGKARCALPLRRLLVVSGALLMVAAIGVLALIVHSQSRITNLALDARDNVLPQILAQQDMAHDIERMILFGELVLNSQNPVKRREGRLSAQVLAYDQGFRSDPEVEALVLETYRTIALIAGQRDKRDDLAVQVQRLLLEAEQRLDADTATLSGAESLRTDVRRALLDLAGAGSEAALAQAAAGLNRLAAATSGHPLAGLLSVVGRITALKLDILRIDTDSGAVWDAITPRLKAVTDTLSVRAAMETGQRFTRIADLSWLANGAALAGLGGFVLLFAAAVWAGNRFIVRPLIAATSILESARTGTGALRPPQSAVQEIGAIVLAAGALAESTMALDAERRKVVALQLQAADQRERDLRVLVAQRTRELEQAKERAEAASSAKGVFLANMSHELRTPLNAVLGFSQLLLRIGDLRPEHQRHLEIIIRSGEHLLQLINDVLDMSKIEAGRVSIEKTVAELPCMVQDVAAMLRMRAGEKGLELAVELAPGLPDFVWTDAQKLRQVMINLLGNAIKFTEHGRIVLRMAAERDENGGGARKGLRIVGEVEDSGIGIDQAAINRIFEPFEQAGAFADSRGTGLGLAISRQFVELLGGTLTVHSTPGRGSTFRFVLPVEPAPRCGPDAVDPMPFRPHGATLPVALPSPLAGAVSDDSGALSAAALSRLPDGLAERLLEAVRQRAIQTAIRIADDIGAQDAALSRGIRSRLAKFDWKTLEEFLIAALPSDTAAEGAQVE